MSRLRDKRITIAITTKIDAIIITAARTHLHPTQSM
jgi:hypothetical protein